MVDTCRELFLRLSGCFDKIRVPVKWHLWPQTQGKARSVT